MTTDTTIQPFVKKLAGELLTKLVNQKGIIDFHGPNCIAEFENTLQKAFDEGEAFANTKRAI